MEFLRFEFVRRKNVFFFLVLFCRNDRAINQIYVILFLWLVITCSWRLDSGAITMFRTKAAIRARRSLDCNNKWFFFSFPRSCYKCRITRTKMSNRYTVVRYERSMNKKCLFWATLNTHDTREIGENFKWVINKKETGEKTRRVDCFLVNFPVETFFYIIQFLKLNFPFRIGWNVCNPLNPDPRSTRLSFRCLSPRKSRDKETRKKIEKQKKKRRIHDEARTGGLRGLDRDGPKIQWSDATVDYQRD